MALPRLANVLPFAKTRPATRFAVPRGALVELSGDGATARSTVATMLLRDAQAEGETALWITGEASFVNPPDLAAAGLDLDALALVRVPRREGARGRVRAAEIALRSGGFGIAVIDFVDGAPHGPPAAWQGRLLGLAREHHARIVLLSATPDDGDSLGPLVSARVAPKRLRRGPGFAVAYEVHKDKQGTLVSIAPSAHPGPPGL